MFRKHIYSLLAAFFVLGLGSCSNTKYLTEDETLVIKNNVKIEEEGEVQKPKELSSGIRSRIRPRSTKKFMGTRLPQWIYNQGEKKLKDTEGKLDEDDTNFLMRLGEKPTIMDTSIVERALDNISNYLSNNGYFNPNLSYTSSTKDQKTTVDYTVKLNKRHLFNDSSFDIKDSVLNRLIQEKFKTTDAIKKGEPYVAQELEKLRADIVDHLQTMGYYRFSASSIYVVADTLSQSGKVDVNVVVDNPSDSLYSKRFQIRDISVQMSLGSEDSPRDTVNFNGKTYYNSKLAYIKPESLDRFIKFQVGDEYDREKLTNTLDRLYDLALVEFANVEFREEVNDGYFLDAFVEIVAGERRAGTFEPEISQFRGIGASGRLAYKNKNLFRGGELFELALRGGFEVLEGDFLGVTFFEIESDLYVPRIVGMPFGKKIVTDKATNARSRLAANIGSQNQGSLYSNREVGISQRWEWKSSPLNEHRLSLLDMSVFETKPSQEFQEFLDQNPAVKNSFETRFIIGGNYNYLYDNSPVRIGKSHIRFEGLLDYSGNLINSIHSLFESDPLEIDGKEVAQFFKADIDLAYNLPIAKRTDFVSHINIGMAKALGDVSSKVPAIKQFTLGGSNSMRAWNQRSLGPGSYNVEEDSSVLDKTNIDQRSDLSLEANVEFRFPLTTLFGLDLNGAVFTDVGNIGALEDDGREGSEIKGFEDLAIGSGFGLRLDIQSLFVVRTDWGYKIYNPALEGNNRWEETPFSSANLTVGIGYPF